LKAYLKADLVTLFDASMGYEKSNDIECMSQDSYNCDDNYCMFDESPSDL